MGSPTPSVPLLPAVPPEPSAIPVLVPGLPPAVPPVSGQATMPGHPTASIEATRLLNRCRGRMAHVPQDDIERSEVKHTRGATVAPIGPTRVYVLGKNRSELSSTALSFLSNDRCPQSAYCCGNIGFRDSEGAGVAAHVSRCCRDLVPEAVLNRSRTRRSTIATKR